MFRKIAGTIGTRVVTAILAFASWTLNAHYLGPEIVGTISLIVFSVAIVQLFTNFVAGAALIYLTPRLGIYRLFVPAYIWSLAISVLATGALFLLGALIPVAAIIPDGYFLHVLVLSLVLSFVAANNMLMLGLEWVKQYNLVNLGQIILLFLLLLVMLLGFGVREVMAYYAAILVSNCLAIIAGLFILAPALKRVPLTGMVSLMKEILRFGTYVQVANIFQALNYRLSLKFVDHFLGRSAVGVLSLGMQLAEGLWLISRSMATVQYSRIANQMDEQYSIRLTLTLIKISFVVTALAMLVVLAIPASVFTTVFSARFGEVKLVITSLSAGIVVLSVSMVLSGFFSGINKPWHNMVSSAIGVVFTVVLGLVLIPRFGIAGAGFAATCSYGAVTLYQFLVFASIAKIRLSDLLITRSEVQRFIRELKQNMPSRS